MYPSYSDYDQILVLENGRLAEFGSPRELLALAGGNFRKMCEEASDWNELRAAANIVEKAIEDDSI